MSNAHFNFCPLPVCTACGNMHRCNLRGPLPPSCWMRANNTKMIYGDWKWKLWWEVPQFAGSAFDVRKLGFLDKQGTVTWVQLFQSFFSKLSWLLRWSTSPCTYWKNPIGMYSRQTNKQNNFNQKKKNKNTSQNGTNWNSITIINSLKLTRAKMFVFVC